MKDNLNDKVISLFKNHSQNNEETPDVKFFKGFNYVKIKKDINGNPLKADLLIEYAKKCEYIVRVMRNTKEGVALYNYKVPYNKIIDFISKFSSNELNGEIIEVEKYEPKDLA